MVVLSRFHCFLELFYKTNKGLYRASGFHNFLEFSQPPRVDVTLCTQRKRSIASVNFVVVIAVDILLLLMWTLLFCCSVKITQLYRKNGHTL